MTEEEFWRKRLLNFAHRLQMFDVKIFNEEMIKSGLDPIPVAWADYLDLLDSHGPLPMHQIAKETAATKANVTIGIRYLLDKGLVTRHRSDKDKRIYLIALTDKGSSYTRVYEAVRQRECDLLFTNITDAERECCRIMSDRIETNLAKMGV